MSGPGHRRNRDPDQSSIILANWGRRFIAWLIDYLVINTMLAYFDLEAIEAKYLPPVLLPHLLGVDVSIWSPISITVFFLYWTFTEWYFGRSIGQLLLNLRLVDVNGKAPSLRATAVQSFGKSLILPLDWIAGWIFTPSRERRQRIFNFLSGTLIEFIGKTKRTRRQGEYSKEP